MRVYSWNMFCYNKQPQAALEFMSSLDADIVCLQEVPESLLADVVALYPHIAHAIDSKRTRLGKTITTYNVILSRYSVTNATPIPHADIKLLLRTLFTIYALAPLGWSKSTGRSAVQAIAHTPIGDVQVYSAHLTLSSPTNRAYEFADLMHARVPNMPMIIAGDFNSFEHPFVKMCNWFLGASLTEAMPTYPERAQFETRFKNAHLTNPLAGLVTHTFSKSQLDHVLVSEALTVTDAGVHPHHYGSDHNPVFVDIAPQK